MFALFSVLLCLSMLVIKDDFLLLRDLDRTDVFDALAGVSLHFQLLHRCTDERYDAFVFSSSRRNVRC